MLFQLGKANPPLILNLCLSLSNFKIDLTEYNWKNRISRLNNLKKNIAMSWWVKSYLWKKQKNTIYRSSCLLFKDFRLCEDLVLLWLSLDFIVHLNMHGIAPFRRSRLPVKVRLKSSGLKWALHTLVCFLI